MNAKDQPPRGQRLRRADRVRDGRDYRRLRRQGRPRRSRHFVLLEGPPWDPERVRLGLTVSRRVGNAVARNRVKRRLREWFRHRRAMIGAEPRDLVLIARPGAAQLAVHETRQELEGLFQ